MQEFLCVQQQRWYFNFPTVPVCSGAQCDWPAFCVYSARAKMQPPQEQGKPSPSGEGCLGNPETLGLEDAHWMRQGMQEGRNQSSCMMALGNEHCCQYPATRVESARVCFTLPDVFIEAKTFEKWCLFWQKPGEHGLCFEFVGRERNKSLFLQKCFH